MRAASSGLRHPASASCLGRHSHLAGRCPNNSSLFPPLAAVVVVAAERLFLFVVSKRLRAFRNYFFTGGVVEGNGSCRAAFCESAARRGSTASLHPHPALRATFPRLGKASVAEVQFPAKTQSLRACLRPLGGAVAQRLRGFKSAEPEKTVKRSSRRTGVNLQFFPV